MIKVGVDLWEVSVQFPMRTKKLPIKRKDQMNKFEIKINQVTYQPYRSPLVLKNPCNSFPPYYPHLCLKTLAFLCHRILLLSV